MSAATQRVATLRSTIPEVLSQQVARQLRELRPDSREGLEASHLQGASGGPQQGQAGEQAAGAGDIPAAHSAVPAADAAVQSMAGSEHEAELVEAAEELSPTAEEHNALLSSAVERMPALRQADWLLSVKHCSDKKHRIGLAPVWAEKRMSFHTVHLLDPAAIVHISQSVDCLSDSTHAALQGQAA